MTQFSVPVRYYQDFEGGYDHAYETLDVELERSCFFLVTSTAATPSRPTAARSPPLSSSSSRR